MASIGIGIGIEDLILQVLVLVLVLNFGNSQVLVLVLVLTLGSSEVLVLVLVLEKWYCPCLLPTYTTGPYLLSTLCFMLLNILGALKRRGKTPCLA